MNGLLWPSGACVALLFFVTAGLAPGCAARSPAPLQVEARLPARAVATPTVGPTLLRERVPEEAPVGVELGRSVSGRAIEALVFGGSEGCVLILGGIHGSEPASADLVDHLARHLELHPEARAGRQVVLIARANPDGLAAGTRWNARGVDLNRNFATGNFRASARSGAVALSEPETRALVVAIARYRPSCIVSVHCPLNCIDADGGDASYALARKMARVSPLPLGDLPALPGSLGSYGGNELGLKMITYELDRQLPPQGRRRAYLDRHLAALLVAVREG